jgi:hypothetical protein
LEQEVERRKEKAGSKVGSKIGTGANGLPQVPYKDGCCRRAQDVQQNRCSGSRGLLQLPCADGWCRRARDSWVLGMVAKPKTGQTDGLCGSHKICIQFFSPRLDRANESLVWWQNTKTRTNGRTVGHTKFVYKFFCQDPAEQMTANDFKIFRPLPLMNDNQDLTGL